MSINMSLIPIQETKSRFHPTQLARLNRSRVPRHIAIIPDGNRRWAKKRLLDPEEGHEEGIDMLMEITKAAQELGVEVLTFFAFSTENWSRTQEEIAALMELFSCYLIEQQEEMRQWGIKLETIGDLTGLPPFLNQAIHDTKLATQSCDKTRLVLALNYGSRNELCRAFKAILEDYEANDLKKEEINEQTINRYLDTSPWGDPELLIRTSGELRVSNFLLWQISYTELYVDSVLWPDFTSQHLLEAILDYQKRERRWGGP